MQNKNRAFYRQNQAVLSDAAVVLLEKVERKNKLIKQISSHIVDNSNQSLVQHSIEKLLKQRTFMLMQGYEDCNDVHHLKHDPLFEDVLGGEMASQPTLSRFENSIDKKTIFNLCYAWLYRYVKSLKGRKRIIIDIDATDDLHMEINNCLYSTDITISLCTMNCFSMMGKQGKSLCQCYVQETATLIGGMLAF